MSNEDGSLSVDEYKQLVLDFNMERHEITVRQRQARDRVRGRPRAALLKMWQDAILNPTPDDEVDLVIHDVHALPERACFISPPGSVRSSVSEPMRHVMDTGEYPSVEDHLEGKTQMWEPVNSTCMPRHIEVTVENGRIKRPSEYTPAP